jgi:CubicO group peptidase (beta-lactamase class C family)
MDIATWLRQVANRHAAVGLAAVLVGPGGATWSAAHGVADIATGTPISEDTVFRVGSITKTFTAVAALQLTEQGLLDLDAPVAERLRSFRLVPDRPGWPPVTARHLLTHTAGLGEVLHARQLLQPVFGEMVRAGRPVPSLAEYYAPGLRGRAEPGTRWRYTGHGFAALGRLVEELAGEPLDRFLRDQVFTPLGMTDTALDPTPRLQARLATGYTVGRGGARPVRSPAQVTAAAGAACSTPRDMARYAAALLAGGANEHGSVLKPETLASMFAPQYRPDPRIPGMGLAFFRGESGGHPVVEHGGIVPGFDAQLSLAPDDGLGVLALTNGTRRGMFWLPSESGNLLGQLLGAPPERIRGDVAHRPELWADLCGWYRLPGPLTDARARAMAGGGVRVVVRGGRLLLSVLSPVPSGMRGFELHPDDPADPDVFRLDLARYGMGTARVVFGRDARGHARTVSFDRGQLLSAVKSSRHRR